MCESNISLKIIKILDFWRKMIFGYGLCSSRCQAVMVLSSKWRLIRLRAGHDAVSHFWGTNKKLKSGFMLKNASVNNAVCPGLKIALPTSRGRSHFPFANVLFRLRSLLLRFMAWLAPPSLSLSSFWPPPLPISPCPPRLRRVPRFHLVLLKVSSC